MLEPLGFPWPRDGKIDHRRLQELLRRVRKPIRVDDSMTIQETSGGTLLGVKRQTPQSGAIRWQLLNRKDYWQRQLSTTQDTIAKIFRGVSDQQAPWFLRFDPDLTHGPGDPGYLGDGSDAFVRQIGAGGWSDAEQGWLEFQEDGWFQITLHANGAQYVDQASATKPSPPHPYTAWSAIYQYDSGGALLYLIDKGTQTLLTHGNWLVPGILQQGVRINFTTAIKVELGERLNVVVGASLYNSLAPYWGAAFFFADLLIVKLMDL